MLRAEQFAEPGQSSRPTTLRMITVAMERDIEANGPRDSSEADPDEEDDDRQSATST